MSLEELNEKIHDREFQPKNPRADLPFTPETPIQGTDLPHALGQDVVDWTKERPREAEPKVESSDRLTIDPLMFRRKKLALLVGGAAILILMGATFFWTQVVPFTTEKAMVSITGPKDVESNKSVTFKILYENENWKDLENTTLIVSYPSSFQLESGTDWSASESRAEFSLGTIESGTKGTAELRGSFHSFQNQVGVFRVTLRYAPEGISSRYDTSAEWTVTIASSAVILDVTAPLQVGSDQVMEYAIEYKNESDEPLDNMRLKIDYPEGFRFTKGDPKPTEGESLWYIGNIAPGGKGTIRVWGTISGVKDDVKKMTARLGKVQGDGSFLSFGERERVTRIVASPLFITQAVNGLVEGNIKPGETLVYTVKFRNDGDLGLRDLIVTVDLDTTYLDIGKLRLSNGAYNPEKRQILFKASDVRRLAQLMPGEGGQIDFSVPVKSDTSTLANGAKNLLIETTARIDSPDVPTPIGANKVIASNVARVKILSELSFDVLGYYTDTTMPNTGPIPPQVGKETTYTFHVKLGSSLNDITVSRVSLLFPSNIRYIGTRTNDPETVSWNNRSGELIWEVGTLIGGVGKNRELVFQVGITPDESLVGKVARLLNKATLTGEESFGRRDIRIEVGEKTTRLGEDVTLSETPKGGEVVPAS